MDLTALLVESACRSSIDALDRADAINKVLSLLAEAGIVTDPAQAAEVFLERDSQRHTGVVSGFAFPRAGIKGMAGPKLVVCKFKTPIQWDERLPEPVEVMFMLIWTFPKDLEFLKTLSRIAKKLGRIQFRESLKAATSDADLYKQAVIGLDELTPMDETK